MRNFLRGQRYEIFTRVTFEIVESKESIFGFLQPSAARLHTRLTVRPPINEIQAKEGTRSKYRMIRVLRRPIIARWAPNRKTEATSKEQITAVAEPPKRPMLY